MILVCGSPRSGTSWLGKIFDSHPDTLYRYEPDIADNDGWPPITSAPGTPITPERLDRLIRCNMLKPAGSRPVFRKSYLGGPRWLVRGGCVYLGKAVERVVPGAAAWRVPDFVDPAAVEVVVKAIVLHKAAAIAAALPDVRPVLIVRHPCGHLASVMRGRASGRLPRDDIPLDFADTEEGRRFGLTSADLRREPPLARLAWSWAVNNTLALERLPRARVVLYEELCADPASKAREILGSCGLSWSRQTAAFVAASTSGDGGYFRVRRRPLAAANAWRRDFPEVGSVLRLVADTPPGRLFA